MMALKVAFAAGCAWRAIYISLNGKQVAHIGVDPNNGTRPQAFGGIAGGRTSETNWSHAFRLNLPTLRFKHPMSPLRSKAYGVVHTFWHKVDGRYGWGSK